MHIPLEITFRGMDTSAAVEMTIERWLPRLEQAYGKIQHCSVAIEQPHQHRRHGNHFEARVDISVPDREIVVSDSHEDVYVAVANAFRAARRQLQDYAQIRRGEVKAHAAS